MCNLSLNQGVFPDILKIANVIPFYKKRRSNDFQQLPTSFFIM